MQVYNQFVVTDILEHTGELVLAWFDNTRDQQGNLVTPINRQTILERTHKIPVEAEQNAWDRAQLLQWFMTEVEDIASIPAWAQDEADRVHVENQRRLRVTDPAIIQLINSLA